MYKINIFLLFLFFIGIGTATTAQNPDVLDQLPIIKLSSDQNPWFINDSISVFYTIDTLHGKEALTAIRLGELTESAHKKHANINLAKNGFWLVFELMNMDDSAQEYYLELAYNRTDLIMLYEVNVDSVNLLYKTGDLLNFNQRPIDHRNFVFPLPFLPNQKRIFLLNLEKRNTVDRFPLKIYTKEQFIHHSNDENIFYGLFFGILVLVILTSLGISIYMRIPMFAFYSLYAFGVGLFLFTSLGLTFQIITPNRPEFNYDNLWILIPITVFFMIKFCQAFFSTKKYFKKTNFIYNLLSINLILILLIWGLASSFYQQYAAEILEFNYVIILSVFCLTFLTAHRFRKINYTNAILFGIGYTASFIGIGYAILNDYGVVYSNLFTDSSLSIISGFFVEFVFLTSAMAVYIRRKIKYFDYTVGFQRATLGNGEKMVQNNGFKTSRDTNEQKAIAEKNNNKIKQLTEREQEILHLIATGKTSQEIAELLFISIHTIQTHRKHIWKKLDIKSYNQLLTIANAFEEV